MSPSRHVEANDGKRDVEPRGVPATGTIAVVAGVGLAGVIAAVAALIVTEPDDDLQRVLALVGVVLGISAGIAALVAAQQRKRAVFTLVGQILELELAAELLREQPYDVDLQAEARALLDQTSDDYSALVDAGAFKQARDLQAARAAVKRALAKGDGQAVAAG